MRDFSDFDKITISLASPIRIREWSYGEVKKPETINYRTLKPEREGLFCEKIFGTTKEWECSCGKFKGIRYKGVICDRCGVEVAHFKVRRERMGHIELAAPVSHIWYYKSVPSRIGLLLGISVNELRSVLYYEKYIVIDPGDTELKVKQILTEEDFFGYRETYGPNFIAEMGAGAIKQILENINLDEEKFILREKMNEKGKKSDNKLLKRLEIIEDFRSSGNRPEWMILEVIPVIPPELRPMVPLDGGRFATSDLNDLYRRVINRNNRLNKLLSLKAPEIIIRNEKRMLQEAVDALFDNSRRKRVVKGPGNRPLKSLSDMLKGKGGRFRQNLLGKRVDYSGRSVIVIGPKLKFYQCGLPKKMALELFKPFIMKGIVEKGLAYNIKSAKKKVEKEASEVWGVLEEVIKEHPVMLNRAPTLHRLGIQAFEPTLVEGKAIKLHPLVCTAFNADFDGDQMAVHVPLSAESQIEAWLLMLSARNLLNPANGSPIVGPTKDITLGLAYLTKEKPENPGSIKYFSSFEEALLAADNGIIDLQTKINARHKIKTKDGRYKYEWLKPTTAGRIIFNTILPDEIEFKNYYIDEGKATKIISEIFQKVGYSKTVETLDKIKDIGFKYATYFGATIGIDDMIIPNVKKKLIEDAEKKVNETEEKSRRGLLTNDERYNKVIAIWTKVVDKISEAMMEELKNDKQGFNPLYMMATSGARGSKQQIRQFAGMRGLMAKPSGAIIEVPVKSNFKEGLTVLEYFNSTHGARKGLADTALKTADAGYLTRRLVDIAQDVVITMEDCGTINGIEIQPIKEGDEIIESISDRVVGRVSLDPIINPRNGKVIIESNTEIEEEQAKLIEELGIDKVKIRTVLTCEAKNGVCIKCYGRNLATNRPVEIGEAVGIIAAQSIGQPGTQLTMRTFHVGGIASKALEEESLQFNYPCIIRGLPEDIIKLDENEHDAKYVMSRKGNLKVQRVLKIIPKNQVKDIRVQHEDKVISTDVIAVDKEGNDIIADSIGTIEYNEENDTILLLGSEYDQSLKNGAFVYVDIDQFIPKGYTIAKFEPYAEPIISEVSGIVIFRDIIRNVTLKTEKNEQTNQETESISEVRDGSLIPRLGILTIEENNKVISDTNGVVVFENIDTKIHKYEKVKEIVIVLDIDTLFDVSPFVEHHVILEKDITKEDSSEVLYKAGLELNRDTLEQIKSKNIHTLWVKDSKELHRVGSATSKKNKPNIKVINTETGKEINYPVEENSILNVEDGVDIKSGKILAIPTNEINYSLPPSSTLSINELDNIKSGDILAKIARAQAKTKDITGGLPRVQELFEARKPKDACVIAEQSGTVRMGEKLKGKNIVYIDQEIINDEGEIEIKPIKHAIPLGKRILIREEEKVEAGTQLCDGPINPHDILKIEGDQKLQEYLLNEIQEVYRLQGVRINDKHIGVIIRQMLKKVEITDVGDTNFIIGQQVDKFIFREENRKVVEEGGKPATAKPTLLGITKASLSIESWISAASFQETTKVLTNAAIKEKTDHLRGLKENVIIGHLVPAGTGIKNYENVSVNPKDGKEEVEETETEKMIEE